MRAPWRETLNVEWTDERPTKPGEYWLSLPPDQRSKAGYWRNAVHFVRLINGCSLLEASKALQRKEPVPTRLLIRWPINAGTSGRGPWVESSQLDGALWARHETPADPFKGRIKSVDRRNR